MQMVNDVDLVFCVYEIEWFNLFDSADVTSKETSLDTNMVVFADGQVYWASIMKTRIPCSIDVRYYPFDDQNCTMAFSSLTYNGFEVDILEVDSRTDDYISNGEWKLITINAERKVKRYPCCAEYWSELRVTISIERRWLFYMFNMMLPCFLITLVALLGFYVPPDSGEKVTMGLTTLLSMIVFLLLVADTMPASPDILPLIGGYLWLPSSSSRYHPTSPDVLPLIGEYLWWPSCSSRYHPASPDVLPLIGEYIWWPSCSSRYHPASPDVLPLIGEYLWWPSCSSRYHPASPDVLPLIGEYIWWPSCSSRYHPASPDVLPLIGEYIWWPSCSI